MGSSGATVEGSAATMTEPSASPAIETVEDADLEAAVDEADTDAGEPAEKVLAAIDAMIDGAWKEVAKGTAIGHKRIVKIAPTRVEAVRVRVAQSDGEPVLKRVALHRAVR